jgi:cytidylate kinase
VAALYGAAGDVIAQRVAEKLGVPMLDREIPAEAARRLGLTDSAVEQVVEQPQTIGEQILGRLGRAGTISANAGDPRGELDMQERRIRGYLEEAMARASEEGGVVLGRGGMVVLGRVPGVLHVHLGGPEKARVRQAMETEGIDHETAAERRRTEHHLRIGYVRRAYCVDGEDPALYHLALDSTAIGLDTCVELIVAAARDRTAATRAHDRDR